MRSRLAAAGVRVIAPQELVAAQERGARVVDIRPDTAWAQVHSSTLALFTSKCGGP